VFTVHQHKAAQAKPSAPAANALMALFGTASHTDVKIQPVL